MRNNWKNQKVQVNYQEKEEKHEKVVLLRKPKLSAIEALISKALIDTYISHHNIFSVNMLREYNERKEEIKILKLLWIILYKYGWYKQRNVWQKWCRNNYR